MERKFIISHRLKWLRIRRYFLFSGFIVAVILSATAFFIFNKGHTKAAITLKGSVTSDFSNQIEPAFSIDTAGIIRSNGQAKDLGELAPGQGKISSSLKYNGEMIDQKPEISTDSEANDRFVVKVEKTNQFKPGKYQLEVSLSGVDKSQTLTQDFTWGVLALNMDQSSYKAGETANIGIGVLNDEGRILCNAKVWLKIIDPRQQVAELSTENKTIAVSDACANGNVTNEFDYAGIYAPKIEGKYQIELKAETVNGSRSLTESFEVLANPDFVIKRHDTSMRIVPTSIYTVNINVLANKNLSGGIKEKVPASFSISNISTGGEIVDKNETTQTIAWPASLKVGESIGLSYEYDAPDISPEFYLLGPIEIWQPTINIDGDQEGAVNQTTIFTEPRPWQIAADSPGHTPDTKAQILDNKLDPVAVNYTCGAGATLLVLSISTTTTTTRTGGSPTYNGVALIEAGTQVDYGGEGTAELWYMLNPPTGSALSISVPNTGALYITVIISSYKAQAGYTSAFDATNQASSTGSTNPTVSVTSSVDGDVYVDSLFTGYTSPPTANNRVLLYKNDTGNESNAAQYYLQTSAGAAAMSYTQSSDDWFTVAAAFKEVALSTISGTVYTNEAKSGTVNNTLMAISINGGPKSTASTNGSGVFSFSKVVAANDTVTIWIDDITTYTGNLVTQAVAASTNITGLEMYDAKIVLRDEIPTTGAMTNTLLNIADNLGDSDFLFSVSGGTTATFTDAKEVWVESSHKYTPGGTVIAHDIELSGTATFTPAANNVSISGSYKANASSTLTTSGTITFSSVSSETLISGGTGASHAFNNLTKSGGGTLQLSTNAIDITGTLSISASTTFDINAQNLTLGTLNNIGSLKLQGGETTVTITTMDTDSGTVEYVGTGTYASLKAGNNYYNLTINNASGTWTLGANLIVYGVFNLNAGTFNASSRTIELAGGGTPFIKTGTFNKDTSTVQYTANANTNITAASYYNLELIDPPTPQQHSSVNTADNVVNQPVSTPNAIFKKIYNYQVNQFLKGKQIAVNSYNNFKQLFTKLKTANQNNTSKKSSGQTIYENIPLDELQTAINVKDNQLIGKDDFKAKLGSQETYFEFINEQKEKYWIKSNLIGAENRQASEISRETIKWQDVLPGVDVEQKLYENRIKESIIVKDEKVPITFNFKLNFSPEMEAKAENGEIIFTDKNSQTVLVKIEKPVAKDQNNQEFQFKYTLDQDTLKLEPAEDLKNISYPLIIDPSYTVTTSGDAVNVDTTGQRKLVRDSSGNLYTVYHRSATKSNIFAAKSTDGGQNWTETAITTDTTYDQAYPSIAIDSNNYLHVVWQGSYSGSTTYYQIRYAEYTTSWQAIQTITSEMNGDQYYPAIAIDSNNYLHVVWMGKWAGGANQIRYIEYTTSWQTIQNLTTEVIYEQQLPSIAIDSNNYLHVVWNGANSETGGSVPQIRYIEYTTSWQTIQNLTSDSTYGKYNPSIAIDSNNYLHVVCYGNYSGSTTYYQIFYFEYITSWSMQTLTSESYHQGYPSIAIDSNNYLHVVWQGKHSGSTTYYQIRYIEYTTSWQTIQNLTSASAGQLNPKLIWANHPTFNGAKTNRPKDGYAFIWLDGTTLKYYASSDLAWDTISPTTYTLSSGTFVIDGYFTNGNSTDTMTVTAATNNPIIDLESNMTIAANCTFIAPGSAAFNIAGSYSNSGIFTANGGMVTFDNSSSQTLNSGGVGAGKIFNNLTHSGAGTLQLITNAINIDGVFTNSAGTFDANDLNMNVADDFLGAGGTFSADVSPGATTQTVTFDGTNEATVSGSNTFRNLTMNTTTEAAGKTIKFPTGLPNKQTISNTWILDGDSGKLLTLRSTVTDTAWEFVIPADINPSGDYIDVKDSQNNTNGYRITAGANYANNGNNTPGWLFPSANTPPDTPTNLGPAGYIDAAGWMNDNTPTFNFDITDPDTADLVKYSIQIDDTAGFGSVVLDYQPSSFGAEGTYNYTVGQAGSYVVGSESMTLSDSAIGGGYYWRVKAIDDDLAESAYEEAGVDSTIDFRVDATAPTGGTIYDGTDGTDDAYNNGSLSALSAYWTSAEPNFNNSGKPATNVYQYAIGTTAGGTDTKTWTATGTSGTDSFINSTGLTLRTGQTYYFSLKATDAASNISTAINSNGIAVAATLSFSYYSGSSIPFDPLNSGNGWTDSAKVTVLRTSTNAYGGYVVKARATDELRKSVTDFFDHFVEPNSLPTLWHGTGFGYTTSDDNLSGGTADRFTNGGPKYAGFAETGPGEPVADNLNPSHIQITNDDRTITYRVTGNATTPAGTYTTTIVYTCIPQY